MPILNISTQQMSQAAGVMKVKWDVSVHQEVKATTLLLFDDKLMKPV